jgi:hypothetical protein
VIVQHNTWSCAVRSTYGALWAMSQIGHGEHVTYGDGGPRDVYDWMVPGIDDASTGLHYGNAIELVALLRRKGYAADRKNPARLADVQARAGLQPLLLGFHGWGPHGHWVYCRGVRADGMLILENPAGTYEGISDRLRDSFDRIGPATMVFIDLPAGPTPHPPEDTLSAAERAELDRLRARMPGLITAVAYLADDVGDRVKRLPEATPEGTAERNAIVAEMQRVRVQQIGPRPGP